MFRTGTAHRFPLLGRTFALLATTCIGVAAISVACGDDDGADDSSLTPSPATQTPAITGGPDETPGGLIDGVLDLAVDAPLMTVYGAQADDLITGGTNIALGDFNADGVTDLLVGAPQADGPDDQRPDAGEAYVFFGPLEGTVDLLEDDADITIYGASGTSAGGDALGSSVFAGDLDDDGIDDVMAGAPAVTAGFDPRTDQGRLYIFYGGPDLADVDSFDLADDVYDMTITGSEGFSRLSTDVELGDINGDGRTDLLVSSPYAGRAAGTPPGSQRTAEGEIYVIFGTGERLTGEFNMAADDYDVLLGGSQEFGQFGASFAVGDVNDDGFDDVVAGAYRNDAPDGRPSAGAAYVFFGDDDLDARRSVLDGAQDVSVVGATAGSAFGLPIAAGDFNDDGFDDFAIGAQSEGADNLGTAGALRIFFGSDNLPSEIDLSVGQADVLVRGSSGGALLPTAMGVIDTNGDGVDDLVFTSALGGTTLGRNSAGLIYMVPGGNDLPESIDLDAGGVSEPILGPADGGQLGTALRVDSLGEGLIGIAALAPGISLGADRPNVGAVFLVALEVR